MTVTAAHTVHRRRVDEDKENVRADSASAPPPPQAQPASAAPRVKTRARSGSFSYFPGNSYVSGNPVPPSMKLNAASRQPRLPYNVLNGERIPTLSSPSTSPNQYHSLNADANRATPIYTTSSLCSLTPLTPILPNIPSSLSTLPSRVFREKEAGARYVAGILINRGKASQRKRPGVKRHSSKEYVKSSLSSCLTVDC